MIRGRAALHTAAAAGCMLFAAAPAAATDIYFCQSIVTRPLTGMDEDAEGVPAEALPSSVKRGTIIRHVTQYIVRHKTGVTGFCAHFDRCYRDATTVHGHRLKAQRLLNCRVDFAHPAKAGDEMIYGLVPVPGKVSTKDLRAERAFSELLKIGIESERLAYKMADAPRSRCARIGRRALAGDRAARAGLANAGAPPSGDGMEAALQSVEHPDLYRACV
jgi:hypothetical protein